MHVFLRWIFNLIVNLGIILILTNNSFMGSTTSVKQRFSDLDD